VRESQFTAALRSELVQDLYVLKLNVAYARGVPDCYYSGSRADLWSEHKFLQVIPPTIALANPDVTTPLQQQWLIARHTEGRRVAMIVGAMKDGKAHGLLLPGLEWQKPIPREEFLARLQNKKALAKQIIEMLGPVPGPTIP
jgi:hypothetical protein